MSRKKTEYSVVVYYEEVIERETEEFEVKAVTEAAARVLAEEKIERHLRKAGIDFRNLGADITAC